MNDRDIEDTRQPEEYDEVETCIFCGDDFPLGACLEYKEKNICPCCLEDIVSENG